MLLVARLHPLPHVLAEDLLAKLRVATVLIYAVPDIFDVDLGVVELEAVIEGHVPPAFLQFEGDDLEGALRFELESERSCFILACGH